MNEILSKDEFNAMAILTMKAQEKQRELDEIINARQSVIGLLEAKYNATFDTTKGIFTSKVKK